MEKIEHISNKIGVIERRLEHLERRLKETPDHRGRDYDEAEMAALRVAIVCMKLHRADAEGIDGPVHALRELVDVIGPNVGAKASKLKTAVRRAESVLKEWE